jgi:hypothetical protein
VLGSNDNTEPTTTLIREANMKLWDGTAYYVDYFGFITELFFVTDQALALGFNLVALFISVLTCITGPGARPAPPRRNSPTNTAPRPRRRDIPGWGTQTGISLFGRPDWDSPAGIAQGGTPQDTRAKTRKLGHPMLGRSRLGYPG